MYGFHARAAALFKRAAAAWDRLPQPSVLSQVFERLSELGARADADRVGHRLRRHGREARRPWRGGRRGYGEELSPRVLEVVRLVIAGKTNREIAAILSKSPNTVAGQLQSAMRKLGVNSRTALAVTSIEAAGAAEEAGDSFREAKN